MTGAPVLTRDVVARWLDEHGHPEAAAEVRGSTGALSDRVQEWLPALAWAGDRHTQRAVLGPMDLKVFYVGQNVQVVLTGPGLRLVTPLLRPEDWTPAAVQARLRFRLFTYLERAPTSRTWPRHRAARAAMAVLDQMMAPLCTEVP